MYELEKENEKLDYLPSVDIIIPCYNEKDRISDCLDSLISNEYPHERLSIIVIDGMSQDGTRDILKNYIEKHPFIRMLDNPRKIKPVALNLGIGASHADVVMRIDTHSIYPPNYISQLVENLNRYQADNSGAVRKTSFGDTSTSRAIALGISHPFSVGNAYWRTGSDIVREVDTVYCGCYPRKVFSEIGFFNEKLIRTQDKEFNLRLKQAGGRIVLDPKVSCTYLARQSIWPYLRWVAQGSYWLYLAGNYTDVSMTSWKNSVPLAFLVYYVGALIGFFWFASPLNWILLLPLLFYYCVVTFLGLKWSYKLRDFGILPALFIVLPGTHLAYGLGSLWGIIKSIIRN